MTGKIRTLGLLLVFVFTCVPAGWTAHVEIESKAVPTSINMNGRITVTITVSGPDAANASAPILKDIQPFTVKGPFGQSSQVSIINGRMTAVKSYSYFFYPTETGTFTIGRTSVTADGEVFTAPGTEVTVTAGGEQRRQAPPEDTQPRVIEESVGNRDIFIKATTDKATAYVGEQVTFTFELYNRINMMHDTGYEPPSTIGFWTIDLQDIPTSSAVIDDRIYQHSAIKQALFPTTSGELTIGSASLTFGVGGILMRSHTETLQSKPIEIRVKPLPETNVPETFDGAVGKYRIEASIDTTTVHAGEVVTVNVTVTGDGNLDLVTRVRPPDLSSFRTYDPRVSDTLSNSGLVVGGSKQWEYIVIPTQEGKEILGSFTLSFFNPGDERYHTVSTDPFELTVLPPRQQPVASAENDRREPVSEIASDINYLKPGKETLSPASPPLHTRWYFPLFYLVPSLAFVTAFIHKRRRDTLEMNTGLKRRKFAYKHASEGLEHARSLLDDGDVTAFCGQLNATIISYVSDMLSREPSSLGLYSIESVLLDNGVPAAVAEKTRKTLELCDFIRFSSAGPAQAKKDLLQDARSIVDHLHGVL